jgi:hypothetical protein
VERLPHLALSLKHPWAWAVVCAGKSIENRKWNTKFRGEFCVHASKTCSQSYYEDAVAWMLEHAGLRISQIPPRDALTYGGILGVSTIIGVLPPDLTGSSARPSVQKRERWHMLDQFGFVLEETQPTKFVPCPGRLGFFDVSKYVS